jgi:hypothetical protein
MGADGTISKTSFNQWEIPGFGNAKRVPTIESLFPFSKNGFESSPVLFSKGSMIVIEDPRDGCGAYANSGLPPAPPPPSHSRPLKMLFCGHRRSCSRLVVLPALKQSFPRPSTRVASHASPLCHAHAPPLLRDCGIRSLCPVSLLLSVKARCLGHFKLVPPPGVLTWRAGAQVRATPSLTRSVTP